MRGDKDAFTPETVSGNKQAPSGIDVVGDLLGDTALADNLRQQALRMAAEAKGLLAESERMLHQAETLAPSTSSTNSVGVPSKKTRGRPKKTVTVA
jgi:adenosylcobinamide amidohydrolase